MKSFVCETNCGEMILTIRYCTEYENFKLYLNSMKHSVLNNTINFYADSASCPIKAERNAILQEANRLVNYHYIWSNENEFKKWFNKLWKQAHIEDSFYIFI